MTKNNEVEEEGTLVRGRATPARVGSEEISWQPGEVIADLYEVKRRLGGGGMGEVWLVHHQRWNVDLAVKSPLPNLVAEPHVVGCAR